MRYCEYEWGLRVGQRRCRCIRLANAYRWWAFIDGQPTSAGWGDVALKDLHAVSESTGVVLFVPAQPRQTWDRTALGLCRLARFAIAPSTGVVACDLYWGNRPRSCVEVGVGDGVITMPFVPADDIYAEVERRCSDDRWRAQPDVGRLGRPEG